MTTQERISLAKNQILDDMVQGTIPTTVTSFSELHDYVDANYYGDIISDHNSLEDQYSDIKQVVRIANHIQTQLHTWLTNQTYLNYLK